MHSAKNDPFSDKTDSFYDSVISKRKMGNASVNPINLQLHFNSPNIFIKTAYLSVIHFVDLKFGPKHDLLVISESQAKAQKFNYPHKSYLPQQNFPIWNK